MRTGAALGTTLGAAICAAVALGPRARAAQSTPDLWVIGDSGWSAIPGQLSAGGPPLVLPLLSRSERVLRGHLESRGVRVRLGSSVQSATCDVRVVEHASDQRVALVDGLPCLLGPPQLPRSAVRLDDREQPSVLAQLARLDGVLFAGQVALEAESADGLSWIGFPDAEASGELGWQLTSSDQNPAESPLAIGLDLERAIPWQSAVELKANEGRFSIQTGAVGIDQLIRCRVERLDVAALAAVRTRPAGGPGELWLELPRPPAGRTVSVLIHATALEAEPRAIEAVAEPPSSAWFEERSRELGLEIAHLEGPDEQLDIRPTMGPGAAWGDFDGDGWFDLYAVGGGSRPGSEAQPGRFFVNQAGQGFAERSHEFGARSEGAGMGALFFEANGDGWPDLFVAQYGDNRLLISAAGGPMGRQMVDQSEALDPHPGWNAGVAAADVDLDGDLDLYVTSYLVYDEALIPPAESLALRRDDPPAMLPYAFPAAPNALFINQGTLALGAHAKGRAFSDQAEARGVLDSQGRGMQAVFFDYDGDGDSDLYVANDVSPNSCYENDGSGHFKNVAFDCGLDDPRGGMGLAVGDVDLDGDPDLFLSNWELDANGLYINNVRTSLSQKHRTASFTDIAVKSGLAGISVGRTGWGAELFDADGDLDQDLFLLNGYTSPDYESTGICVGQPAHFFLNDGSGRLLAAFDKLGPAGVAPLPSRCLAAADFDRDGDLDFFATSNNGPARLFVRNDSGRDPKVCWLAVVLKGASGNPAGIGAEVRLEAEGLELVQELRAGTSYLAGNPPELLFLLPQLPQSAALHVRWPGGRTSRLDVAGWNRRIECPLPPR